MPSAGKVMMTLAMAMGMGRAMELAMRTTMVSSGDATMLSILAHALIECKNSALSFFVGGENACSINPLHGQGWNVATDVGRKLFVKGEGEF